ncbi:hypothetical protein [Hyunsoonleella pacifica]|uniref:Uncharacterized protein n=1 Tax=Hyunsoonleella pacifica TaxID=1080224 RepID=A0A4Q9FXX1_9FLAO|nr:hypothetical protein [Hyunsoonleella pacifica]TBN19082.1 hypothetical protein EYD46_03180 [Hyunsoonleella pacifica]GGD07188.1 hypothetical protein GCM10011368_06330 [Hyunsoonleella pacifica]
MKRIIILLIITVGLYSCSDKKRKTFNEYGGIILYVKLLENNTDFKEKLKKRLSYYSKLKLSEYSISEKNNELKITLAFFLDENKLNNLIFSKGQFTITKGDSIFFNSNSIEKINTDFNMIGQRGIKVKFKEQYKQKLENFTINNLNQNVNVLIDTTTIMSPRIGDTISNGNLSILVLKTKNFDSDIVNSVMNNPYNESVKTDKIEKRLFLKSNEKLVEVSQDINIVYGEIKKLVNKNKSHLFSDLKSLNQNEQFSIKKEINTLLENDLSGYLAVSNYKEIKDLKQSFLNLKKVLEKYDSDNELINMIKSINELTEFEIFEIK